MALVCLGTLAMAPAAGAEDEITVQGGFGGKVAGTGPVPVKVQVKVGRLVRGTLELTIENNDFGIMPNAPRTVMNVEVPAGTTKVLNALVANPYPDMSRFGIGMGANSTWRVVAVLRDNTGKSVDQEAVNLTSVEGSLVGVLPGVTPQNVDLPDDMTVIPNLANSMAMRGDVVFNDQGVVVAPDNGADDLKPQPVTFWRVDPDSTTASPWESLSQVVATPADLGRLSDGWRSDLLTWAAGGGRLVIDSEPSATPSGYPSAWASAKGSIAYGLGEVAFSRGEATRGNWAKVVVATSQSAGFNFMNKNFDDTGMYLGAITSLAKLANFQTVNIKTQALALIAYIFLVGPLLFIVLARRSQQPAAWWIIPAVAVLATGAVWVVGNQLRSKQSPASLNVVELYPDSARVTTLVGLSKPSSSDPIVRFPAGSQPYASANSFENMFGFDGGNQGGGGTYVSTRSGLNISMPMTRNGFGVTGAVSSLSVKGRVTIEAKRDGATGDIVGTVKNDSAYGLESAIVSSPAGLAVFVGSLPRGESKAFRLDAASGDQEEDRRMGTSRSGIELMVNKHWGQMQFSDNGFPMQSEASAEKHPLSLWSVVSAGLSSDPAAGVLFVSGWSKSIGEAEVRVEGQGAVKSGPTLVVSTVQTPAVKGLASWRVSSAPGINPVHRFAASARTANSDLKLIAPGGIMGKPKVWLDGEWKELTGPKEIPRRIPPGKKKVPEANIGNPEVIDPTVATAVVDSAPVPEPAVAPTTTVVVGPNGEPGLPVTTSTTAPQPTTTLRPAAELFPGGASSGGDPSGPPATITRPAGQWPLVDISEPRPQTDFNEPLLHESLNLWDVPEAAVINGYVYISAAGGDTWHRPLQMVEVARG